MNLLRSCVVLSGFYTLIPNGVWAQAREFKTYKTHEAYCQDNPKMPTCIKVNPFNVEALTLVTSRRRAGLQQRRLRLPLHLP